MFRSLKVGVVLGGGGARGIAHLGVLSVLQQAQIPIDMLAGTSFGAVVAALYALDPDARRAREKLMSFLNSPKLDQARLEFMRRDQQEESALKPLLKLKNSLKRGVFYGISITRQSFISRQVFGDIIAQLIEDKQIDETRIPLRVNAADLVTGKEYVWDKGPLRQAISATCALPGIFPPVRNGDAVLMDGGWVNPIPVKLARDWGADFIIAVDTSVSVLPSDHFSTGLDLLMRADILARAELAKWVVQKADVVIRPDVGHVHWSDFGRPLELIVKGEQAAQEKIETVKRLLAKRRFRKVILG